jgi:hypothetical protein
MYFSREEREGGEGGEGNPFSFSRKIKKAGLLRPWVRLGSF